MHHNGTSQTTVQLVIPHLSVSPHILFVRIRDRHSKTLGDRVWQYWWASPFLNVRKIYHSTDKPRSLEGHPPIGKPAPSKVTLPSEKIAWNETLPPENSAPVKWALSP